LLATETRVSIPADLLLPPASLPRRSTGADNCPSAKEQSTFLSSGLVALATPMKWKTAFRHAPRHRQSGWLSDARYHHACHAERLAARRANGSFGTRVFHAPALFWRCDTGEAFGRHPVAHFLWPGHQGTWTRTSFATDSCIRATLAAPRA